MKLFICIVCRMQFDIYQPEAGDLVWPSGMVDECDMDVDIDVIAEVLLYAVVVQSLQQANSCRLTLTYTMSC